MNKIKTNKGLIFLVVLFLFLFFVKACLYSVVSDSVFAYIENLFSFIPEIVLFYIFVPVYYLFLFPMIWVLNRFAFLNALGNQYLSFLLDIQLTIVYLAGWFFVFKRLIGRKKGPLLHK